MGLRWWQLVLAVLFAVTVAAGCWLLSPAAGLIVGGGLGLAGVLLFDPERRVAR